jgi:hypothetical protein
LTLGNIEMLMYSRRSFEEPEEEALKKSLEKRKESTESLE